MKARARKRIVWILAIIFALAAAAFFSMRYDALSQKQIEGKPFAQWVRDLGRISTTEHAQAVLVKQGPAAIPMLLDAIKSTRGISARLETRLTGLVRKRGKSFGEPVYWELARGQLLGVISDIGFRNQFATDPPVELNLAVQSLVDELTNSSESPRGQTTLPWRLGQFGPIAKPALPAIIKLLREGNSDTRVLHAVANIGAPEYWRDIIAAATNKLSVEKLRTDKQFQSQRAAIRVVGTLGTNATSVVPQLVELLDENSSYQQEIKESALIALAQIGSVPPELKPRLNEIMAEGTRVSSAAAAAMLRIDPTEPTALAIVRSRLHPAVDPYTREPVVEIVSGNPFLTRLMEPQLLNLASRTNMASAQQARFALKQMRATEQSAKRAPPRLEVVPIGK